MPMEIQDAMAQEMTVGIAQQLRKMPTGIQELMIAKAIQKHVLQMLMVILVAIKLIATSYIFA